MPVDFTFAAFDALCNALATMPVFCVSDYLTTAPPPDPPFAILRFDVDYREAHAVKLAAIAAHTQLRGSFYFRYRHGGFPLDAIHAIAGYGHEIGYHFETLDTCGGDIDAAATLFAKHVATLRAAGFDVRTAAAHGSAPTAPNYASNRDLVIKKPDLLTQTGLRGETTVSINFSRVRYLSDANWRWRCYDDFASGAPGTPTSLRAQLARLPDHARGLYINIHPQQWFPHPLPMRVMRARNQIGRPLVPLLRRWHILKPDR